jgi:hypothetical protein
MKKKAVLAVVLVLLFSTVAFGRASVAGHQLSSAGTYLGAKGLGLGIIMGTDSGISVKNWVSRENAVQFDAGWDFTTGSIGIGAAYLMHNFDIIKVDNNLVPLYFGIKGWVKIQNDPMMGIQVPLGIDWIFRNAPIDIFLQIEPGIVIYPSMGNGSNGGIGVRYWFK